MEKLDQKKQLKPLYQPATGVAVKVDVPPLNYLMIDRTTQHRKVHALIEKSGCTPFGKHHEIYLSDIRKADSKKWKTVIRQPMR